MCLVFTGLHKHYWLDLHDKNEKMGFGPTLIPLSLRVIRITAWIQEQDVRFLVLPENVLPFVESLAVCYHLRQGYVFAWVCL